MQSWLAKKLLTWVMGRTRAGDLRPVMALDAPEVQFTFPGQNSWSGVFCGKAEVRRWLERLTEVGVKTFPDEVVCAGPPWNSTIVVRGTDFCDAPGGERVYENRFVIWGRLRWGRLREYEVYEDTHKANVFDEWVTAHEAKLAA